MLFTGKKLSTSVLMEFKKHANVWYAKINRVSKHQEVTQSEPYFLSPTCTDTS